MAGRRPKKKDKEKRGLLRAAIGRVGVVGLVDDLSVRTVIVVVPVVAIPSTLAIDGGVHAATAAAETLTTEQVGDSTEHDQRRSNDRALYCRTCPACRVRLDQVDLDGERDDTGVLLLQLTWCNSTNTTQESTFVRERLLTRTDGGREFQDTCTSTGRECQGDTSNKGDGSGGIIGVIEQFRRQTGGNNSPPIRLDVGNRQRVGDPIRDRVTYGLRRSGISLILEDRHSADR
mmetsp:Transcript_54178/g.131475  ORF Transcript_54178/g.131475 Transcript_54178/m.131475 type:complete len:232 (-) Transcript_54178:1552-2247(-)